MATSVATAAMMFVGCRDSVVSSNPVVPETSPEMAPSTTVNYAQEFGDVDGVTEISERYNSPSLLEINWSAPEQVEISGADITLYTEVGSNESTRSGEYLLSTVNDIAAYIQAVNENLVGRQSNNVAEDFTVDINTLDEIVIMVSSLKTLDEVSQNGYTYGPILMGKPDRYGEPNQLVAVLALTGERQYSNLSDMDELNDEVFRISFELCRNMLDIVPGQSILDEAGKLPSIEAGINLLQYRSLDAKNAICASFALAASFVDAYHNGKLGDVSTGVLYQQYLDRLKQWADGVLEVETLNSSNMFFPMPSALFTDLTNATN